MIEWRIVEHFHHYKWYSWKTVVEVNLGERGWVRQLWSPLDVMFLTTPTQAPFLEDLT